MNCISQTITIMTSQYSYGITTRANKENKSFIDNENICDMYRNNKENIPPNDSVISKQNRVFGKELSNIPRKPLPQQKIGTTIETKPTSLRRSATLEMKNVDSKRGLFKEIKKTNNFINENDEHVGHITLNDNKVYYNNIAELVPEFDTFDEQHKNNTQIVATVAKDIFVYLKQIEQEFLPKPEYMTSQNDINEKMRAILIDWLVDVNVKFKLVPECLFMTWNLIDRYLTIKQVTRHKLQLVGVAALLIACKYEEIYPPPLKEFVAICDKAYTAKQILEEEAEILLALDFKLTHTSPLRFLDRYCLIGEIEEKAQMFAKYLIETTLLEYSMLKYKNSLLAAGAVFLVNKIFKKHGWTKVLEHHTGFSEAEVKPCAKD